MTPYESSLTLSASVIKQGDTVPVLMLTFQDNSTGAMAPVDLTGATIRVVMKGQKTAPVVGSCTLLEASHGTATWAWTATDTGSPDSYTVEATVTTTAGVQTFPNAAVNNPTLEIDAQLDSGAGV